MSYRAIRGGVDGWTLWMTCSVYWLFDSTQKHYTLAYWSVMMDQLLANEQVLIFLSTLP